MLAKTAVIRWHLINACIPWESKRELIFFEKVGTRLLRGGRSTVAKIAPLPPFLFKILSSLNTHFFSHAKREDINTARENSQHLYQKKFGKQPIC